MTPMLHQLQQQQLNQGSLLGVMLMALMVLMVTSPCPLTTNMMHLRRLTRRGGKTRCSQGWALWPCSALLTRGATLCWPGLVLVVVVVLVLVLVVWPLRRGARPHLYAPHRGLSQVEVNPGPGYTHGAGTTPPVRAPSSKSVTDTRDTKTDEAAL